MVILRFPTEPCDESCFGTPQEVAALQGFEDLLRLATFPWAKKLGKCRKLAIHSGDSAFN